MPQKPSRVVGSDWPTISCYCDWSDSKMRALQILEQNRVQHICYVVCLQHVRSTHVHSLRCHGARWDGSRRLFSFLENASWCLTAAH